MFLPILGKLIFDSIRFIINTDLIIHVWDAQMVIKNIDHRIENIELETIECWLNHFCWLKLKDRPVSMILA